MAENAPPSRNPAPGAKAATESSAPTTDWLSLAARFFFPESYIKEGKKIQIPFPEAPEQDELEAARLKVLQEPAHAGSRDQLARDVARAVRLWRKASPEKQKQFLNVMAWISDYHHFYGENEKALRSCSLVERWGRRRENWAAVAASHLARGNVLHHSGKTQDAIHAYQEARHICDWILETRLGRARSSILEAQSWRRMGNVKIAMGLLTQAVDDSLLAAHTHLTSRDVQEAPYDEIGLCISGLQGLGGILNQTGNQKTAFDAFEMSYQISQMQGLIEKQYMAALGMAASRNRMGLEAETEILEELESKSEFHPGLRAKAEEHKGNNLAMRSGPAGHVLSHYRKALTLHRRESSSVGRLGVHRRLIEYWVDRGIPDRAELHLRHASALDSEGTEMDDRLALRRLGMEVECLRRGGSAVLEDLITHFEATREQGFDYESLLTAHRIAEIADDMGREETASKWWERTRYLCEHCGATALFDRWGRERGTKGLGVPGGPASTLSDYGRQELVSPEAESSVPGILQKGLPRVDLAAHGIITRCPTLQEQASWIAKLASTSLPVLIRGESGTGKELFATLVHALSPRRSSHFITINCGALPEEIIESELFGHRRGSFTGATRDKPGLVSDTHKGTLFLDEIGDMPIGLQPKLLRTLELGEVRRVGDTHATRVDVRFVAATNQDLGKAISHGAFREDLYFRLKGLEIVIPPLRDRPEDIEPLARYFLRMINETTNVSMSLPADTIRWLTALPWKGNVRELKYSIDRAALIAAPSRELRPEHFGLEGGRPPAVPAGDASTGQSLNEEVAAFERSRILVALEQAKWNKAEAARLLGLTRTTLNSRIKRLNIRNPR